MNGFKMINKDTMTEVATAEDLQNEFYLIGSITITYDGERQVQQQIMKINS